MKPSIRPIDRAAQGLSKTPLIAVIGRLEGKISTDNGNMVAGIKNQKCIAAATSTVPH